MTISLQLGSSFSHFHLDALTFSSDVTWTTPVREVSVRRRGAGGATPVHCACINPNVAPLRTLLEVCPDINAVDEGRSGRRPVHYAAAAKSVEPLK